MNLLELLESANALEIDDHFIRYFGLDFDTVEDSDDPENEIILHVQTTDDDCTKWEWVFTVKELETAEYIPETNEWAVTQPGEQEPFMVTCYSVSTLGID